MNEQEAEKLRQGLRGQTLEAVRDGRRFNADGRAFDFVLCPLPECGMETGREVRNGTMRPHRMGGDPETAPWCPLSGYFVRLLNRPRRATAWTQLRDGMTPLAEETIAGMTDLELGNLIHYGRKYLLLLENEKRLREAEKRAGS